MADAPAYGGLDPSIVNGLWPGVGAPVAPVDDGAASPYGIHPNIVGLVQNYGAPPPPGNIHGGEALATAPQPADAHDYALAAIGAAPIAGGPPGAPPPTEAAATPLPSARAGSSFAPDGSLLLPSPIVNAVQNQFAPPGPATVGDDTPQSNAIANKAYAQKQAAQTAFDATPEGIEEKADAIRQASIDRQSSADAEEFAAEKKANDATAEANAKAAERADAQEKINAAENAAHAANIKRISQQTTQQVQNAIDYKVDTNRDVGTRGLIAIALSGIGNALDHYHGPNAAAQILDKQIDDRIADQWKQKDQLFKNADASKGMLDQEYRGADFDRQQQDYQKAVMLGQQAREIKSIADQTANPKMQQRAADLMANRDQMRAAVIDSIAQRKAGAIRAQAEARQQAFDNSIKGGELGVKQGELAETSRKNTLDYNAKMAELKSKGDVDGMKQLKEQQDEIQSRGVKFPVDAAINDDGTYAPKFAQLVQQDGKEIYLAPKGREKDVQEMTTNAQLATNAVNSMRDLRDKNGGHIANTAESRLMAQELVRGMQAIQAQSGIKRISEAELDMMQKRLTGDADPDSVIKNVMPNLERARKDIEDDYNIYMQGAQYTGKRISFPDPLARNRATDSDSKKVERTLLDPFPAEDRERLQSDAQLKISGKRKMEPNADFVEAGSHGMFPSQLETLNDLEAKLADPASKQFALQALDKASRESPSSGVRERATRIINRFITSPQSEPTKAPADSSSTSMVAGSK